MAFLSASAAEVPAPWRGSLFIAAPDEQCLLRVSGLSASPPKPEVERVLSGFGRIVAVLSAADGLYFATANSIAAADASACRPHLSSSRHVIAEIVAARASAGPGARPACYSSVWRRESL